MTSTKMTLKLNCIYMKVLQMHKYCSPPEKLTIVIFNLTDSSRMCKIFNILHSGEMAETTGPAVDVTEFALEVHVHVMETL
jgi:hypothetical protein